MRGDSGISPGIDWRAVGYGVMWGLILLVLGAFLQGVIGLSHPLAEETQDLTAIAWQAFAGLVGGLQAARMARGGGWLHGALSGLALILVVAVVMSISSALPTMSALGKIAGIGVVSAVVGGMLGVNWGRR